MAEPVAPESVRRRSAHVLAATQVILALLAGGSAILDFVTGPGTVNPLTVVATATVLVALPGAWLEWNRDHRGEGIAAGAFAAGALTSMLVVLGGYWWYVPFLGTATLILMLTLMYRVAVRSEANVESQRATHTRKTT